MNKEKQKTVPELRFPVFENDWEKVKLKDVSTYFNGKSFEGDVQEEGRYELITLKSIDSRGNLVHSKRYINDEVPTLAKGTLVMILSEQAPGLLGMTAIIPLDNKFVLNQRVAEIRPNDKVESFFLSMAINRNQRIFSRLGAGMKVQNISKPNVENYEFYYPTLAEQQKIADCLSSLDDLLQAETEKLDHLKEHKKGLLQQLFPANGETVPQYRFSEFVVDGDWEITSLNKVSTSIFDGTHQTPKYTDKGIPFFSVENIVSGKKNKFISNESHTLAIIKNKAEKDDILITRIGNIGYTKVIDWDFDFSIYVTLAVIKKSDSFISKYLNGYLQSSRYQKEIQSKSLLNAAPIKINMDELRKTEVLLPPSKLEQQKIGNCLSSVDDLILSQTEKIEALKEHKKGLMQQLFPNINDVAL